MQTELVWMVLAIDTIVVGDFALAFCLRRGLVRLRTALGISWLLSCTCVTVADLVLHASEPSPLASAAVGLFIGSGIALGAALGLVATKRR